MNDEGWPLSPDGYELTQEIGQGAFAKVFKARCPSKDTWVAVKIMALENITTSLEEIQAEVRTMKLSRHENVLDLHCCFCVRSDLWLVMPLMDKGSAYYAMRVLRKSGKLVEGQGLPEEAIATILREVLQGLEYIHSQHQVHRDIKAGNILLNAEGRCAIADFGVAGWLSETGARSEGERRTFVGTPCWMAPEVMEQQRGYNEKADIWSLGITALELARGYAPYSKYAPMQVLIKTIREPPPSIKSYVDPPGGPKLPEPSDKFNKFVARCLQKDPRLRCVAPVLGLLRVCGRYIVSARQRASAPFEFLPGRFLSVHPMPCPALPCCLQALCARAAVGPLHQEAGHQDRQAGRRRWAARGGARGGRQRRRCAAGRRRAPQRVRARQPGGQG